MKAASPALITLLEQSGARDFWTVRCVSIATKFGVTLRYTEADVNIALPEVPGVVFRADGAARVRIGATKQALGLEVDTFEMTLLPVDSAGGTDLGATPALSAPLLRAAQNGLLDMADVTVWRAFAPLPGPVDTDLVPLLANGLTPEARTRTYTPTGAVKWFVGSVAPAEFTSSAIELRVRSLIERLDAPFPPYVYRAGCHWPLYGTGCGVDRATYQHDGVVIAGATQAEVVGRPTTFASFESRAKGFFNEGVLEVLSGANAYIKRAIREHAGGHFVLATPLPYAPAVGNQFRVVPGCDKTYDTCGLRFGNQARFRGFPYVPGPDALTGTKMTDVTEKVIRVPELPTG